jgi:hypothetical protein
MDREWCEIDFTALRRKDLTNFVKRGQNIQVRDKNEKND